MGFFSGLGNLVSSAVGAMTGGPWGTIASAAMGYLGQKDTNDMNVALSRDQMEFQERMSSTAHQREVADLKAAGLNPMLSALKGNGASTPTGSLARVENPSAAGISAAVNAASLAKLKAETATAETQADLNQASALKVAADTRTSLATAQQAEFQVRLNDFMERQGNIFLAMDAEQVAKLARGNFESLKYSNDWNTIGYLNEFAVSKGFRNFEEAIRSQDFRASLQDYALRSLEFPKSNALADFYKSSFGHDIAPYLNSASSMENIGAGLVGTGVKLFGKNPSRFEYKGR